MIVSDFWVEDRFVYCKRKQTSLSMTKVWTDKLDVPLRYWGFLCSESHRYDTNPLHVQHLPVGIVGGKLASKIGVIKMLMFAVS